MTSPAEPQPAAVVAYCAPGFTSYATALLAAKNETYDRIEETQAMKGRIDVMLVTDPTSYLHQPPTTEQP